MALARKNRFTDGMFDRRNADAKYMTPYGYGLSADSSELHKTVYNGQNAIEVAVGAIHGGRAITRGVCRELVGMINSEDINIGDIVKVCAGQGGDGNVRCNCNGEMPLSCVAENEGEEDPEIPEVVCIGIRG